MGWYPSELGGDLEADFELEPEPAPRRYCPTCAGQVVAGSTCPRSLPCPRCGAKPNSACRRPSGHRANELHAERYNRAEDLDTQNGVSYT